MKISVRGWLVIGIIMALLVAFGFNTPWLGASDKASPNGQLTEASLGQLLAAMGLKPKKVEQRYDFTFKAVHQEREWDLSMTAVLSRDGKSIWAIAWLDELPRSAADVPRTALLRLLSDNDRLGNGKFFAYVASNRRFVLQRVIPNGNITTASFRDILQDLGSGVVVTYPNWSVASWKSEQSPTTQTAVQSTTGRAPTQSVLRDSKFKEPIRR